MSAALIWCPFESEEAAVEVVSRLLDEGLIAWANDAFNLKADSSIEVILVVVLFGIGTDYILFLLFRYRERRRLGDDKVAAVVQAMERAGEAIVGDVPLDPDVLRAGFPLHRHLEAEVAVIEADF